MHTHNWLSIWVVGIQTRVLILQTKALTHRAVFSIPIFITNEKRLATFNYCVYQNHWYLTGYLYYNKGIDLTCGSLSIVAFLSLSPSSLSMYVCMCVCDIEKHNVPGKLKYIGSYVLNVHRWPLKAYDAMIDLFLKLIQTNTSTL